MALTADELKMIQSKRLEESRKNSAKRKPRGLDVIDQLDCTGLYTGLSGLQASEGESMGGHLLTIVQSTTMAPLTP
jgi:hypothetical protein